MTMRKKILLAIGIVIIITLAAAFSIANNKKRILPTSKSQSWYAVHLSNGHVYFVHPAVVTPDTITLNNTFLMEVYTAPASQTASSTNFQLQDVPQQVYNLTRRGESNNMRTDNVLFIDRHSVLFWEKLNSASEMVKWLEKANK